MKLFWKQYIISGVVLTFGYFLIYQKLNPSLNLDSFLTGVPIAWTMLLGFALIINFFLNWGDKE